MTYPSQATKLSGQISECQRQVCEAFLAQDALVVIIGLIVEPLARHPRMTDRDSALVELVIAFLRNILVAAGPAGTLAVTTSSSEPSALRIKASLVAKFFDEDVSDLLMLIAQHAREASAMCS